MKENVEILRKESIISVSSTRNDYDKRFGDKIKNAPKDTFYLCSFYFFILGFMTMMPLVFIGTAFNYWMFKFRNTTAPAHDPSRTSLQSLYESSSRIASSIPSVIFTIVGSIYAGRLNPQKCILSALTVILSIFVILSLFTQIDTDSWQTEFFALAMILTGLNSATVAIYQMFSMVLLTKFPSKFLNLFLLGTGGGILTDFIQIISISVTDSDIDGALIYFLTGTFMVVAQILLTLGMKYIKLYTYYSEDSVEDQKRKDKKFSWSEVKEVAKDVWPPGVILFMVLFAMTCVHPSVTSLVISQYYMDGTWGRKYFTPVITFLLSDISSMVGRILSWGSVTKTNYPVWMGVSMIRLILSVSFIFFCNAQPRSHLPVVFDEDWQFILFIIIFNFSGGLIMNVSCLSLPRFTDGDAQIAMKLLSLSITILMAAFSANGVLIVKLL
ncbi:equilibrative nucleoside transporter 3 isoform X1 [Leptinotarsa decemlineata]|uniref:equilibrative nucleoside transporter 3 isoform X1 n=1 Tax=Leptinotarsa decemlineata TaxID=7539 RepID=UPI003D304BB6